MDPLILIRVILYFITSMILFSIGLKVFISIKGMFECEFKTALKMLGASMTFFGVQLLGWGIGDSLKELSSLDPFPINVITSISALFVVGAMLYAVTKIQNYLGEEA